MDVSTGRLGGIDLNLLVALGALLEERNVTHAGLQVGISQPAMSGALSRLRAHFGDDLLRRTGRTYELTPLAAQIQPAVRAALRAMANTLDPAPEFDPRTSRHRFMVSISDYALTVLVEPLLTVLAERAPNVSVDFDPVPPPGTDYVSHLMRRDLLVSALGYDLPGRRQVVFRDSFVCIVSAGNPRLRDGALTLDDLGTLRHAAAGFGAGTATPADRMLDRLGVPRNVEITVQGLLPLPFAVAGTDLCAFVPARLAHRCAGLLDIVVAQLPVGPAELVEAAHWHPSSSSAPSLLWLREVLREVSHQVEPVG